MTKNVLQYIAADKSLSIKFFLILATVAFAALETQGGILPVLLMNLSVITIALIYLKPDTIDRHTFVISCCIALYIYSIATSTFLSSSAMKALSVFSSTVFVLSLASHQKAGEQNNNQSYYFFYMALLLFSSIHSLVLVISYFIEPIRQTGLLRDYSQASMLILLTYGLCYLKLKKTAYIYPITLLFFLGFFTTFSRTSNVLLIIFLIILFFIEYKKNSSLSFLKIVFLIGLCALFIKYFPLLIDQETISRGGLEHFKTLNSRTHYWSVAWNAILEKPWTGHGLGSYEFTGIQEARPHHRIYHIHNDYLQIWHDLGVFWLILFIIISMRLLFVCKPYQLIKVNKTMNLNFYSCEHIILWSLVVLCLMYMSINFILSSSIFLIIIGIISIRLFELSDQMLENTSKKEVEFKNEIQ